MYSIHWNRWGVVSLAEMTPSWYSGSFGSRTLNSFYDLASLLGSWMPRDLFYCGHLGVHKYLEEDREQELMRIARGLNDEEDTEEEDESEENYDWTDQSDHDGEMESEGELE